MTPVDQERAKREAVELESLDTATFSMSFLAI